MRKRNGTGSKSKDNGKAWESIDVYYDDGDEVTVTEGESPAGDSIATFCFSEEAAAEAAKDKPTDAKPLLKETANNQAALPAVDVDRKKSVDTPSFIFNMTPSDSKASAIPVRADPVPAASHSVVKGMTPPIDGEQFTMKRCYQYRPSTIRKLHEIKAGHPDINVYLNTILDEAIIHYYEHVFKANKITACQVTS